jgi:hypothetical protein
MNQSKNPSSAQLSLPLNACPVSGGAMPFYRGTWDCFRSVVRCEGFGALFKGWLPIFSRQGPQTVIILTITEAMRKWLGLPAI